MQQMGGRPSRTRRLAGQAALLGLLALSLPVGPAAAQQPAGLSARSLEEPIPAAGHAERRAPADAPNVLVWMIDDLGFGQLGSFGGLIDTPNLDRLARNGLRYSNYHTTPICSASRAAFLTGRNSHHVHIGGHAAMAIDLPGHDARVPRAAGTVAENLRQTGYVTFALGKWDHLPTEHASPAGPFTYWPSGQGFDRFYGFLSYDTDNFAPMLWSDHSPVAAPQDPDYHLTADLADRAIDWISARDAGGERRPFFMYWATGAVHSPHHAPDEYLKRYRGRFDGGWDEARREILRRQKALGLAPKALTLPPRPEGMPAWDGLSPEQKRSYARAMEAFAAQLTHADAQFGRVLAALEARGELDNTLVVVTSDNGASAEGAPDGTFSEAYMANGRFSTVAENLQFHDAWGGPKTYPLYPVGWAVAGNTPFRYYKQTAYEGGTRVPLILSWPRGISERGGVRRQFQHVTDLAPTILAVVKAPPAKVVNGVDQMPFDGASLSYSFSDPQAANRKQVQYFEMYGNRAIWADGWKAVIPHRTKTWDFATQPPIRDQGWELYHIDRDMNEQHDLAASEPERLRTLLAMFDAEARRYNVYPLINTGAAQAARKAIADQALVERQGVWAYATPVARIPEVNAPPIHLKDFRMAADIDAPPDANGVLFNFGGRLGGMSLYLLDGHPVFAFQSLDQKFSRVASRERVPAGASRITLEFQRQGAVGAKVRIGVDAEDVAAGEIAGKLPTYLFSSSETFDIGQDQGTAASPDYQGPFRFSGRIKHMQFVVAPFADKPAP